MMPQQHVQAPQPSAPNTLWKPSTGLVSGSPTVLAPQVAAVAQPTPHNIPQVNTPAPQQPAAPMASPLAKLNQSAPQVSAPQQQQEQQQAPSTEQNWTHFDNNIAPAPTNEAQKSLLGNSPNYIYHTSGESPFGRLGGAGLKPS